MSRNAPSPARNNSITGKPKDWQRVGRLIAKRRSQLKLTQRTAAERAKNGWAFWNTIENAKQESYSQRNITAIEETLGWPLGSIEQMLLDKDFVPAISEKPDYDENELEDLRAELDSVKEDVQELKVVVKRQSEDLVLFRYLAQQLRNMSAPQQ